MQKVYSSPSLSMVYCAKNVLASHGIESLVRGENLTSLAGEIPWTDAWAELWIPDEMRAEEAREILESSLNEAEHSEEAWKCPACGEELEGQFTECWKCGAEKPIEHAP